MSLLFRKPLSEPIKFESLLDFNSKYKNLESYMYEYGIDALTFMKDGEEIGNLDIEESLNVRFQYNNRDAFAFTYISPITKENKITFFLNDEDVQKIEVWDQYSLDKHFEPKEGFAYKLAEKRFREGKRTRQRITEKERANKKQSQIKNLRNKTKLQTTSIGGKIKKIYKTKRSNKTI